ncbi:hypothetical protein GIB67_018400 [Kingdonia uniflora]|uniref:Uncharacterized protein n=1 Tax=Kingdonia uniflora TaxID=39325 RepID=A0A7J7MJ94_9MAGN|nr:hypothetical protein GIB67_018400 [Kingdonia uniflora]
MPRKHNYKMLLTTIVQKSIVDQSSLVVCVTIRTRSLIMLRMLSTSTTITVVILKKPVGLMITAIWS